MFDMHVVTLERLELCGGGPSDPCWLGSDCFPSVPEEEEDGQCSEGK